VLLRGQGGWCGGGTLSHNLRAVYNSIRLLSDFNAGELHRLSAPETAQSLRPRPWAGAAVLATIAQAFDAGDYRWVADW